MFKFLRKMWNDKRGNTLAIAAACMPLFVGAAGLATDTIQWTLWKRQLQRAADSAAMAGVYDRVSADGETANTDAAVARDLKINLHTYQDLKTGQTGCLADGGVCEISYDSPDASNSNITDPVQVTLRIQQPLTFSSIFLSAAPTITATSTAAAVVSGIGDACIQALETSASATGITNTGNTTVDAPNCILYSNSPSANSAAAGGSSDVTAKAVAAVGGIQHSNNFHVGKYLPYSPALTDPFGPQGRNVTPDPADMHCAVTATTKKGVTTYTPVALSDGMDITTLKDKFGNPANCFSSLSVGSTRTLNIPADFGPIYLNGGGADLKGAFNCSGCTIVLTNISTASNATIGGFTSNAQASNTITAPTDGDFMGIAIYQDRRATASAKVNGGSSSVITGALYFPSTQLTINGGGTATSMCAMFIARRIDFSGNSGLALTNASDDSCAGTGLPTSDSSVAVRLVG